MAKCLEVHLAPGVRIGEPGRFHASVAVWVAVVRLLLGRQCQNRAMEWGLGYADRGDGGASYLEAIRTEIVAKNRTTEFGSHQRWRRTCLARPRVFVSLGELRRTSVWTGL